MNAPNDSVADKSPELTEFSYAASTAREFGYPESAIAGMIKTTNPKDLQFGDVVFLGPENAHHTSARSWTVYTAPGGDEYAGIGHRWNKLDTKLHPGVVRSNIRFPISNESVFIIRNGVDIPTF